MSKKPGALNLSKFIGNFSFNDMIPNSPKEKTRKSPPRSRSRSRSRSINMNQLHQNMLNIAKSPPRSRSRTRSINMNQLYQNMLNIAKSPPRSRSRSRSRSLINMNQLNHNMRALARNTKAAKQKEAHMMRMLLHKKLGRIPSPKSKKTIENLFNSIAAAQLFKNKTGKGKGKKK